MAIEKTYSFSSESYLRAKSIWRGLPAHTKRPNSFPRGNGQIPFSPGRDPKTLASVLFSATELMGWVGEFDQAKVISGWAELVGSSVAQHTKVVEIAHGTLVVQVDSSAWTTELRRLRGEIVTKLQEQFPAAEITELKFLSPGAPSWRHGPRTVPGRGPRDTYA